MNTAMKRRLDMDHSSWCVRPRARKRGAGNCQMEIMEFRQIESRHRRRHHHHHHH